MNERIRECRKQMRFTIKELAESVGISNKTLMRFEKGERQPTADRLRALALALNTTVSYLTGETDDPSVANASEGLINQTVHGTGNISTNTVNSVPITEQDSGSPWWPEVLVKAYEMERNKDPRLDEARATIKTALEVLDRASTLQSVPA